GRRLGVLQRVALGLVMAGAVGNAADRLRLHYVVAFVHVRRAAFSFPVFNVADACIVVGAALLLRSGLRGPRAGAAHEPETSGYDTSEEDEPVTYAVRPAPAHARAARQRMRPLDELPELPPLRRASDAE